MISIPVDFNRRGREGCVIGSLRRATGPIEPGSLVRVYQPGDPEMDYTAQVISVAPTGKVELEVDWPAAEVEMVPGARLTVRRGRAPRGSASGASTAYSTGPVLLRS